jgi:hypothetical protein
MLYSNDKKCIKSKKTSSFRLPLLSRIIAFFVLISFSTSIFANGFDNSLPDGVDTNTLEMYLDRADLAVDREEWYRLATYGAEIVVASWENEYLLSLENPDNTGAAITPVELMNSIDDIMEKRYTEWIVENFFNDSISGDSKSLFDSIKETNMEYLSVIDEETGELKKDEAGDLVLQKSDNLEEDNASWITAVTQAIDASIDSFIDMSTQWYSEIALLLNPEETPWLDDEYDRHFSDYEESYREELDFIFLYEQRRFYNYRTLDQYSLEKKSEKEGAESIANGLIESAQEDLLGGLQKLKDGLDAIDESDPTGASTIEAENWREEFRIVFEEGMRKWETAEEELLFERVQWDQRVEEDVKTGEQIWVDAYEKLSKSRIQWQNDLNDLIDEGLAKWSEIDEALITSITKAKTELNENIEKRKQSLSTQVNSLVDIYVKSTSVIRTARDSIKYWIEEHYIETYHDESYWIENEEFWADTSKFRAEYQISPDDRSRTVENILYWKNALSTYKNYKTTAEEKLIGTYGIILKDSINSIPGLDWNSFENGAADDLLGNLDLTTWESEEASIGEDWENRYLDKYQVELVKARALKDYWDKQLEIARAVYDYSNDISSERDQDVVTQQKYTDAKDAFDLARDGYNGALQALTAEAETLADVQETMTEKMDLMKESQLALEQAQKDYQDAFLIFTAGNDVYFSEKITRYYKLLAEKAGFAENQPENSYADYLMAYHDAASKYDESLFYQNLNTQVFHLINGFSIADSSVKIEGLQDLYEKKEAAELWDFNAADWALELEKLDISPDSNPSLYNQLMNEFNWRTSISNENKDIDLFFSEIRINSWVEIGKRLKIDPYERTYEEISLLTSPSMDKWFEDINFDSISSDYESEISGMNKIDQIQYLGDTSQGRFLFERAELELAVFSKIKSLDVTSENWSTDLIENIETDSRVDQVAKAIILDRLFYGSKGKTDIEKEEMKSLFYEQIDEWIEPLNNLVSFFKSGSDINTEKFNIDNYRDEYRELVGTSDIIKQFIAGISYLSLSAPQDWISDDEILGATERQYSYSNLASYLTEDLMLKKNSFASWNSILTKNLNRTAALRNEQKSNALVKTGEVLSNYNIAQLDNSAFVFIPPEETWETWESSGLTIDRWFTDLQLSLQESYEGLPSFVISETGNYISSLVSYFVLKASLDGIDIGNTYALNDETMENDLINAQNEKIRQIYNLRLIINEDRAQSNGVSSINLSNLFKINSLIGDVSDSLPGVETADIKNEVLELASAFVVKEINKDAGFIDYSSVTSEDLLSILNEIISEYDEDVLIGIDESFKNEIVENSQSIIRIASMLESDYLNDIAEITDPEVKQAALYKIWSEIFISANDEGDSSEITVLSAFEASEEVVDSISMSFFKVYCDLYENWTDTGLSEEDQIAYLLEETSNNNSTLLNFMERAEFITFQMESPGRIVIPVTVT